MQIELSEDEFLDLKDNVRKATRKLVPSYGNETPDSVYVTMAGNGVFDHYTSWDEDYTREIFVVSIGKPCPNEPPSTDPANPYGISLRYTSYIFQHMEEQIKGFIDERLAELAN